jgi:hypothetical protein
MSIEAIAFKDALDRGIGARTAWSTVDVAAFGLNLLIAGAIVFFFHDRFWAEADDGTYAYVADQLRNGAVLNSGIHDPHGGYVHFVNAWALDLFGRDLVSMRYPLAMLTVVQSAITFVMLRPLIGVYAIVGGLAMSALTFVQFLNPTANWYALFLVVAIAALLASGVQRWLAGLIAIGFLLGLVFFFRQLTGVLAAIGVLAWLLLAERGVRERARPVLAPLLATAMALGLAGYAWFKLDGVAFALFVVWPIVLLVAVAMHSRADDRQIIRIGAGFAIGAALAALPIVAYHLVHGSFGQWWHDTTVSAVALTELDFFDRATYARLVLRSVGGLASFDPAAILNGAFWLMVLLAPTVLGIAIAPMVRGGSVPHPLAMLAVFHAIVSAHYAIPLYAVLSAGLSAAGLLTLVRPPTWRFTATVVSVLFATVVGLAFQAGQPLSRGISGIVQGVRAPLDADGLPGASLRMEAAVQDRYRELLGFIDAHAGHRDAVLGLPMIAQLNFLSGRRAPLRYVIAPLGLLSDDDLAEAERQLAADPPAVVFFIPKDKYTTPRVGALMEALRPRYRLCATFGHIEAYAPTCAGRNG